MSSVCLSSLPAVPTIALPTAPPSSAAPPSPAASVGDLPTVDPQPTFNLPLQSCPRVALISLAGFVCMWLAFSPFDLGGLVFLAPAPWVWMIVDGRRLSKAGWLSCWLVATAYWLSLTFWGTSASGLDWGVAVLLAAALGVSFPIFVLLTRWLIRAYTFPCWFACPLVWVALEASWNWFPGGFSIGRLGQAVVGIEWLIQLASIAGTTLLSGLIVAIAACATQVVWGVRRYMSVNKLLVQISSHDANGDASPAAKPTVMSFGGATKPVIALPSSNSSTSRNLRPASTTTTNDQRAIERTMVRIRDRARHDDLMAPLAASVMLLLLIGLTFVYGKQRLQETVQWKLFEGNQFRLAAIDGTATETEVQDWLHDRQVRGKLDLLVVSNVPGAGADVPSAGVPSADTRHWTGDNDRSSVSTKQLIYSPASPDHPAQLDYSGTPAKTLHLQTEDADPKDSGPGSSNVAAADRSSQTKLDAEGRLVMPLPRESFHNVQLVAVLDRANSLERGQATILRQLPNRGAVVDTVIWCVPQRTWVGTIWDHLVAQAAFAAAAANRCSLLLVMPDGRSALYSCGIMRSFDESQHRLGRFSLGTMLVDPRTSSLHRWGYYFDDLCLLAVVLLLLGGLLKNALIRRYASPPNGPSGAEIRPLRAIDLRQRPTLQLDSR